MNIVSPSQWVYAIKEIPRRYISTLLSICLCLSFCLPLGAQQAKAQQRPVSVEAIELLPLGIRQQMPKGSISLLFGEAPIASQGRTVFLHAYETRHKIKPTATDPSQVGYVFFVDIFSRSGPKRHSKFKRISSSLLTGLGKCDGIYMETLWLNPVRRITPIIAFRYVQVAGAFGSWGQEVLLVFHRGLLAKPAIQSLSFGGNMSDTESNSFEKVDERGFIMLTHITGTSSEQWIPHETDMRWNGAKFAEVKSTNKSSKDF